MFDSPIFLVGFSVFLLLVGGLAITLREFAKMGSEDQNDYYPHRAQVRRRKSLEKLET